MCNAPKFLQRMPSWSPLSFVFRPFPNVNILMGAANDGFDEGRPQRHLFCRLWSGCHGLLKADHSQLRQQTTTAILWVPISFGGPPVADVPFVAQTISLKVSIPPSDGFIGIWIVKALGHRVFRFERDPAINDGIHETVNINSFVSFVVHVNTSDRVNILETNSESRDAGRRCAKFDTDSKWRAPFPKRSGLCKGLGFSGDQLPDCSLINDSACMTSSWKEASSVFSTGTCHILADRRA